jgi:hypothetical protein
MPTNAATTAAIPWINAPRSVAEILFHHPFLVPTLPSFQFNPDNWKTG